MKDCIKAPGVQCSLSSVPPFDLRSVAYEVATAGIEAFHVDIGDGHFVPRLYSTLNLVKQLSETFDIPVEVHLMVADPIRWIDVAASAGAKRICAHAEALPYPTRFANLAKSAGMLPGLAFNPTTPVDNYVFTLNQFERVNILTNEPDGMGEGFITSLLGKIERIGSLVPTKTRFQVDGSIRLENISTLAQMGVTDFVIGRALVGTDFNSRKSFIDDVLISATQNCVI